MSKGPRLQGLALVADEGKLYRIGGFTAKNKEDEEQDLWSLDDVAAFDIKAGTWKTLPPLPEPRSSFDAAVLDHKIYVIGGWQLRGEEESIWHETAWVLDLKSNKLSWKSLPKPPFKKRALSVATAHGKIYAIGGMQSNAKITSGIAIYNPQNQKWSNGPDLIGTGMTGFGTSAFQNNGVLFVSTFDGTLQKLTSPDKPWKFVGNLERVRFFHRMLPVDTRHLIFLGGSNMSVGKFDEVDIVNIE